MPFTLRSPAFAPGGAIPTRHTCEGEDLSPPLTWEGAPDGTASYVLIVDDPDAPDPAAPKQLWVHWLAYNISHGATALPEGAGNGAAPRPIHWAVADDGNPGYHGPCPPIGRHRYYFHLYALDAILPGLGTDARRKELEQAMRGHVLGTAELMGTYQKE